MCLSIQYNTNGTVWKNPCGFVQDVDFLSLNILGLSHSTEICVAPSRTDVIVSTARLSILPSKSNNLEFAPYFFMAIKAEQINAWSQFLGVKHIESKILISSMYSVTIYGNFAVTFSNCPNSEEQNLLQA